MDLGAPTLPCARCGVALAVDPEAPEARCRHCNGVTAIDAAVRERARDYRVRTQSELRRIRGSGDDPVDRLMNGYMGTLVVLAAGFTVGLLAPSFGLDVPRDVKDWLVAGFVGGLILLTAVFFLLGWMMIRRELARDEAGHEEPAATASGELAAASASGPCSACGGPVPFRVGEPRARTGRGRRSPGSTRTGRRSLPRARW
jgi:hypothetical protein